MNPYKVLGVSENATEAEISAAYKKLAKKYHPDLHPGDEVAAAKMREVNEAYNLLRSGKYQKGGSNGYGGYNSYGGSGGYGGSTWDGFGGFGGFGGERAGGSRNRYSYSAKGDGLDSVRELLSQNKFSEALNMLESSSLPRSGEWYYLASRACAGLGNISTAMNYAATALQFDPENVDYKDWYASMTANGNAYSARRADFSGASFLYRLASLCCCLLFGSRCFPFYCCFL